MGRPIPQNYFLYVGAIEKTKNVETLVKAIWEINKETDNDYSLVLVSGFGNNIDNISKLVKKLNLEKNVFFTSYLSQEELVEVFSNAVALVNPSLLEGFGLTLLEGMSAGIPVIAANTTALPEIIGEAGVLFNPHSVSELSEIMIRVAESKDYSDKLVERGFNRIKEFPWEKAAQEHLDIYHQVHNENKK